jgi:alkylhydroperoxidase family enzyme
MRKQYLPEELTKRANPTKSTDASYRFSTELFWVVSRINNCHYCLGHQEDKLLKIGVAETDLLALDTDWSQFTPKHQAALLFTAKLTHQPHLINSADIDSVLAHFTRNEILEIAFLVGRYNATNRWTDSLGIPQETHRTFTTQLPQPQLDLPSVVAVTSTGDRPATLDFEQWHKRLINETANGRFDKQFEYANDDLGRSVEQLLTKIPAAGQDWVDQVKCARHVGKLDHTLRAHIAFVAAQEDQAWMMQKLALEQLAASGITTQAAYNLYESLDGETGVDATSAALKFAKKLTSEPQSMTDRDIENLQQYFNVDQIAEIVYHTGMAAMLNRLTIVNCAASAE